MATEQEKKATAPKGGAKGGAKGATTANKTAATTNKAPEQKADDKPQGAAGVGTAPQTGQQTPPSTTGDKPEPTEQEKAYAVEVDRSTKLFGVAPIAGIPLEDLVKMNDEKEVELEKAKLNTGDEGKGNEALEAELEKQKQFNEELRVKLEKAEQLNNANNGGSNKPSLKNNINAEDYVWAKNKETGETQRMSKTTFSYLKGSGWEQTAEEPEEVKNLKNSK